MPKYQSIALGIALGLGLLSTSCSSNTPVDGTAAPSGPAPSSTPSLPSDGAPAVPKPLNSEAIEKAPCSAITADQIASLGAPQKSAEPKVADPGGPKCSWRFASENPSSVTGAVFTGDPNHSGISGLYYNHKSGGLAKFEPFTASGYPGAVYTNSSLTEECAAAVGIRDDLTYTISVSLDTATSPLGNPCDLGKKVAGFVIDYLKKGQN